MNSMNTVHWTVKPQEGWQVLVRLFKGLLSSSSSNWSSSPRFQLYLMNSSLLYSGKARTTKQGSSSTILKLKMMEDYLFPAKSLSLLLRRPHHPVLVTLLQARSANTLYLEYFTKLTISGWQLLLKTQSTLPSLGCFKNLCKNWTRFSSACIQVGFQHKCLQHLHHLGSKLF